MKINFSALREANADFTREGLRLSKCKATRERVIAHHSASPSTMRTLMSLRLTAFGLTNGTLTVSPSSGSSPVRMLL
eukprot:6214312-Pleurochrysis_carterae.AAC.3